MLTKIYSIPFGPPPHSLLKYDNPSGGCYCVGGGVDPIYTWKWFFPTNFLFLMFTPHNLGEMLQFEEDRFHYRDWSNHLNTVNGFFGNLAVFSKRLVETKYVVEVAIDLSLSPYP